MSKHKFFFCFAFIIFTSIYALPQNVKAKIAVMYKYGNDYRPLRSNDRLRAGEMIRIFIQPEKNCYVYVVSNDDKESTILYNKKVIAKRDTLILPSKSEFYVFDDKSPEAQIVIFCSIKKIDKLEKLFGEKRVSSLVDWHNVETNLFEKYEKDLSDQSDKPFPMAGNVGTANDEFLKQQRVLQAKDVLIRKYQIEIKK